ncbi:dipeptide/oligopeptide/nickel ABC transporter ATP-binding protein, partial [Streptomyces nogalater]
MTEDLVLPAAREPGAGAPPEPLLEVSGLTKHFPIKGGFPVKRTVGAVQAVDGLDFQVA